MTQSIVHIALVVNDYDEAIRFYTEKLNFALIEDTPQSETKRWVRRMLLIAGERCWRRSKKAYRESNGRTSFLISENR